MKIAPPVLGKLDLLGLTGKILLVEHDEEDCGLDLIGKAIDGKVNIIFRPGSPYDVPTFNAEHTAIITVDSVARIQKMMSSLKWVETFVIDRIDMMDSKFDKRARGSQISAYLSMITSPRILRDSNVIVTSVNSEYRLREIADKYYNLRK